MYTRRISARTVKTGDLITLDADGCKARGHRAVAWVRVTHVEWMRWDRIMVRVESIDHGAHTLPERVTIDPRTAVVRAHAAIGGVVLMA